MEHYPELEISKILIFRHSVVIAMELSTYLLNLVWIGHSDNCGRILMIFTALESS